MSESVLKKVKRLTDFAQNIDLECNLGFYVKVNDQQCSFKLPVHALVIHTKNAYRMLILVRHLQY